jgi:SAM-dependent methyltransferase
MGLDANGTRLLLHAKRIGLDVRRTATLGRQGLHLSGAQLAKNLSDFDQPMTLDEAKSLIATADGYCEPFLEALGADEVVSFDNSDYEGATELHDFNLQIGEQWHDRFSLVLDAGSLEHIFNVPIALRNCLEMVAPGGHFVAITPANNTFGHGFYQFGPELFFRVCSADNGYEMVEMIAYETDGNRWFEVIDPRTHGRGFMFRNRRETHLFVMARKVTSVAVLADPVQQAIYADWVWKSGSTAPAATSLSAAARNRLPEGVKVPLRAARSALRAHLVRSSFSSPYFRRVRASPDDKK